MMASMFTWLLVATSGLYLGSDLLLKVGCYEGLTAIKQKKYGDALHGC